MNLQSLNDTITRLEAEGESLELAQLRLERNGLRRRNVPSKFAGCKPHIETMEDLRNRFRSVSFGKSDSECWVWDGRQGVNGYGAITVGGKPMVASRVAVILSGRNFPKGKIACHHCDTPLCVNPAHLYVGTKADNVRDMFDRIKINHRFNEENHRCKMSKSDVFEMLSEFRGEERASMQRFADKFKVSYQTIENILNGARRQSAVSEYRDRQIA